MRIFLVSCFLLVTSVLAKPAYFQQYVNYKIDATLNHNLQRIDGDEWLVYHNNAPDTLYELYFHLYFNRFREGALTEKGTLRKSTGGYIELFKVTVNDSEITNYQVERTLMKVSLNKPLAPGDSIRFYFKFASKLPFTSDRFGYNGDHFDVGNWYPTPVVYDPHGGWHLNQHIDNEFYQEWADFKVNLTVPKGFVMGATGDLLNPQEALADTSAEVHDWYTHHQFDDSLKTTTWRWEAHRVHDFAWSADPDYKIYTEKYKDISIHFLIMRHHYDSWAHNVAFVKDCMKFLIEKIGPYPYKQITVADTYITAGGMEYPNIVFINTYASPEYSLSFFHAVIIHEIAHNWFYGLLASNQTEFEWMDEGMTQFMEISGMEALFGVYNNFSYSNGDWYDKHFGFTLNDRQSSVLNYLRFANSGHENDPINTFADKFRNGVVVEEYDKMSMVMAMLENVLTPQVFWKGIHNYYDKWHFKHPGPDDFKEVMEETAGYDLDWFFNEWINSTRKCDYAVGGIENIKKADNDYTSVIHLKNKGDISMPLDVLFVLDNNDSLYYRIPVDPFYPGPAGKEYLKDWHFILKDYSDSINVPTPVKKLVIDPQQTILDVNRLNNTSACIPPVKFYTMKRQSIAPPVDSYVVELWPKLFYNDVDKVKFGPRFYGSYLSIKYLTNLIVWYKPGTNSVDFDLDYAQPVHWIGTNISQYLHTYRLDGRWGGRWGLNYNNRSKTNYSAGIKYYNIFDNRYSLLPWQGKEINTVYFKWSHHHESASGLSETDLGLSGQNAIAVSDYTFNQARLDIQQSFSSEDYDLSLGIAVKAGVSSHNTPLQEQFSLAGANGVSSFNDPYFRSKGSLPVKAVRDGRLYKQDGARVRGIGLYNKYTTLGENILAASIDLHLPSIPALISYRYLGAFENTVFIDAGSVWQSKSNLKYETFVKSFGASISYDDFRLLKRIFGLQKITLDLPVWVGIDGHDNTGWGVKWLLNLDFDLRY